MNSSLGLGTVPLDLMVRDKPGGDGAGQTEAISWQQDWAHRTWEADGSRKLYQREDKLALGADLVLVIHRKLSPALSPALSGPHSSPSHPDGRSWDWGWGCSPLTSSSRESSCDSSCFSTLSYWATILQSGSTSSTSTVSVSRSRLAILGHRESLHQGKPPSRQR